MKQAYWVMTIAAAIAALIGLMLAIRYAPPFSDQLSGDAVGSPPANPAVTASPSPPATGSATAASPTAIASAIPTPTPSSATLTVNSKVTLTGIGPVKVGMTVAEATQVAGIPIVTEGNIPILGCEYFRPQAGLDNLAFMVVDGRIARVDVWEGGRFSTASGLGIGSTEAQIKQLFPNQIQIEPHEYTDGHYVIFVPRDRTDSNYRIVFETDNTGRVTQFRSGKLPEVMRIEGCS